MRDARKKQILQIMESLQQAHKEIAELVAQRKYKTAQAALADCQECMIEVGNVIEETEGESCETVKKIESYCETVFVLYNDLLADRNIDVSELEKKLKIDINKVITAVEGIQVKLEVVFFPYKASMWDSLESIYLAAKKDENCDVYCVPIPYYDLKQDRTLGEMHYEGKEYPANIETTDYETYSFEERKPDMIYIHNPYDDWNLVTCVHPRYFSANLKKYTDKLIYIPYFVLDEIKPDNKKAIEGMKHFCFLPGIVNADRVIVQSEDMRRIYINEYMKVARAKGLQGSHIDRKRLEEKFLGLGSPKFDKVLNTKKEDLEIPEGWLRVIEKPDGSRKKIILYNISITALLENNEKMLIKILDVFKVFKKNKDEIALLWRPHPLIGSTLRAMRPKLWSEYEKIVDRYRREGWGIYDDSIDVDRAVILSDAYYGDNSSVVQLYQTTNKMVVIQNTGIIYNEE